jgi:hypothetical protein
LDANLRKLLPGKIKKAVITAFLIFFYPLKAGPRAIPSSGRGREGFSKLCMEDKPLPAFTLRLFAPLPKEGIEKLFLFPIRNRKSEIRKP